MVNTVYIEHDLQHHPRVQTIIKRIQPKHTIICQHYGEVFNPRDQNFRIQKNNPALVLARKTGKLVLETPSSFGIGGENNYYFSHLLNCIYDCRYCFLQGMYPSAHYVLFINYEDFMDDIKQHIKKTPHSYFFSGYDSDSLALEGTSGFVQEFIPFFAEHPNATLELRTKSTNIRSLLHCPPITNCVVAFSFTPHAISAAVEHKVPSLAKRLHAMQRLAEHGWLIGLRLDPLIYSTNYSSLYQTLIKQIFDHLPTEQLHSVSMGSLRFPEKMYRRLIKLYPKDKLLAHPLKKRQTHYAYAADLEHKMQQTVHDYLRQFIDDTIIFKCSV